MDQRPHPLSDASARDTTDLLYGDDATPGIVAVEQLGANRVRLYRRSDDGVIGEDAPFSPWLLAERAEPWQAARGAPRWRRSRATTRCAISSSFPTGRATSTPCAPLRTRASGSSACARRSSSISCAVAAHFSRRWSFRTSSGCRSISRRRASTPMTRTARSSSSRSNPTPAWRRSCRSRPMRRSYWSG